MTADPMIARFDERHARSARIDNVVQQLFVSGQREWGVNSSDELVVFIVDAVAVIYTVR